MTKKYIVAVDEAGRGPLAGPVTIAAVAAKSTRLNRVLKDIKDSKKLSPKKREEWYKIITENFECKTASVGPKIIDKLGINKAINLAVQRVLPRIFDHFSDVARPKRAKAVILLDGLLRAPKHYDQQTIIKGDEKIPIISAASIIAKVTRDRKMLRLHKKFPQYSLDKHKGYGTKLHYKMIRKYGLCEIHRKSYRKKL